MIPWDGENINVKADQVEYERGSDCKTFAHRYRDTGLYQETGFCNKFLLTPFPDPSLTLIVK